MILPVSRVGICRIYKYPSHNYLLILLVIVVEFESEKYIGSELSGFVEVVVIISGGSSTTPISVMMTTSDKRRATGDGYINN